MSLLIVLMCIVLLVLLISYFKINAFLSFLIVSILAGLLLGIEVSKISGSVQKGLGDMLEPQKLCMSSRHQNTHNKIGLTTKNTKNTKSA